MSSWDVPCRSLVRREKKHRRVCSGDFPARATFEGNEKGKGSNVVRCGKLHHKPSRSFICNLNLGYEKFQVRFMQNMIECWIYARSPKICSRCILRTTKEANPTPRTCHPLHMHSTLCTSTLTAHPQLGAQLHFPPWSAVRVLPGHTARHWTTFCTAWGS